MSRLSSLRQLKLTSAYRIGPARAYLVYFTQSWRSLPSMFVFGTIEDTPNIIRTKYIFTDEIFIFCFFFQNGKPVTYQEVFVRYFHKNVPDYKYIILL